MDKNIKTEQDNSANARALISNGVKRILISLINWYQKLISPDHSVLGKSRPDLHCRFYPTCSEYAKESIKAHGALKGSFLSIARVSRCHPWGAQGVDPVLNKARN